MLYIDDGSMNSKAREAALEKIKKKPKVTVILISFKAGGVGMSWRLFLNFDSSAHCQDRPQLD